MANSADHLLKGDLRPIAAPLSVSDLPTVILERVFSSLCATSLASCTQVCHLWSEVASAGSLWEPLCKSKWKLWDKQTWDDQQDPKYWKRVYSIRMQTEKDVEEVVSSLVWPIERPQQLKKLRSLGVEAQECMIRMALSSEQEGLGMSYWGQYGALYVSGLRCAEAMAALCSGDASQTHHQLEQGALLLASIYYPLSDMALVQRQLDKVAAELKRRMAAAAVHGGTEALQLLSDLLFGAPPMYRDRGLKWDPNDVDDPTELEYVPPDEHGLGLMGNGGDYYHPSNSLLPDVLQHGLGNPISLCVIHAAVGRRAGLNIDCIGMPVHFINSMDGPTGVVFVDAFNSGKLMNREEMGDFMETINLPNDDALLQPIDARAVYVRMCANLINLYKERLDYPRLRVLLEITLGARPEAVDIMWMKAQVQVSLEDYDAALRTVDQLLQLAGDEEEDAGPGGWQDNLTLVAEDIKAKKEKYVEDCERVMHREQHPRVRFRVGDIIKHIRYQYRGVICGWDPSCKMPEQWILHNNVDGLPGGRNQPFYHVLVDYRGQQGDATYVAQENIKLLRNCAASERRLCKINHRDVGEYFDALDETKWSYVPNAYLRHKYPQDWA